MDLKRGKILVTGAGGFIGSHLVERLIKEDCTVRAFVRYNSRNDYGHLESLGRHIKDIEIVTGDLRDTETVRRAVKDCSLVFHLGALIGIPYSYESPADVIATNVTGTLNVLDAARKYGTEKLVVTSTSEVYGTPLYVPIDEKHPLHAQSPYAASKIAADKLAESYFLSYDVQVATLRPFNTFGPRQSARAVIPTIITQALTSKTIRLGSLAPRRDLLFVRDTVDGFLSVAQHESSVGKTFNIGTGGDLSIGDLVEQILLIIGTKAEIIEDRQRIRPESSEVQRLVCNYTQALENLNWQPQYSLEDGLRRTIFYIKENMDAYKAEQYNV